MDKYDFEDNEIIHRPIEMVIQNKIDAQEDESPDNSEKQNGGGVEEEENDDEKEKWKAPVKAAKGALAPPKLTMQPMDVKTIM